MPKTDKSASPKKQKPASSANAPKAKRKHKPMRVIKAEAGMTTVIDDLVLKTGERATIDTSGKGKLLIKKITMAGGQLIAGSASTHYELVPRKQTTE